MNSLVRSSKHSNIVYLSLHTLQKQVGCFNHRVVTLVADKLERQWLQEAYFGMED